MGAAMSVTTSWVSPSIVNRTRLSGGQGSAGWNCKILSSTQVKAPGCPARRIHFQIQNGDQWRVLTEATFRATQARIEATLRMDYETFVNASFFLQGKADQFTQQKPGDRKRILSSILGLEIWETYLEHTRERRKALESEVDGLQGRLAEINAELAEEPARLASLKELETSLAAQVQARPLLAREGSARPPAPSR